MYRYVIRLKRDNQYLKEVSPYKLAMWSENIYDAKSFANLAEVEVYLIGPNDMKYWGDRRHLLSFDAVNPLNLKRMT